ncbi:MAG TPA: hypothetical protein PKY01_06145 [Candidatus Hydrogenedentes bacterium]|nr:hypothetical protein [Candidatus Hydrogenedentota bacterium]HQH51986.1 hypothetical protein [Candidatus Hydrogenedentota bacterium]HQM50134.1 hypothetical protein [Candidatus Hydrogenedentota bacterium]
MEDITSLEAQLARDAGLEPGLHAVDRRARLVARTWHRNPELASALTHRGVNLGMPLEQVLVRDLVPIFAEADKRGRA